MRRIVSWVALCALGLVALGLLNGAFFSAWMAGGPPDPYPDGWALRAKAQMIWALAATVGGLGVFRVIRRFPMFDRKTLALLGAAAVLAAYPWLERQVLVDRCLDNGGRWNAGGMQCERKQA